VASQAGQYLLEGILLNKTSQFSAWASRIESLGDQVRLTVEGGSGYSNVIEKFAWARGWEVTRVSATAVKAYREHIMGQNSKTDEVDARAIASLGLSAALSHTRSEARTALRRATRDRDRLAKDKTRLVNRLRQAIAEMVPEFTTAVLPRLDQAAVLHLLLHHPDPCEWARLGAVGLKSLLNAAKVKCSVVLAEKLAIAARGFENVLQPREKSIRLAEIKMLARRLQNSKDELAETLRYLELLAEDDEQVKLLETITGAGLVLSTSIMAEIQDINDFARESKLASYAGVGLKKHQTGKSADYWLPQTRANRRLKHYLLHLAMLNSRLDPRSAAYVSRKLATGKKPLQARRALARHLIRVLYSMLKKSKPYHSP
jgi:transposase